jgi:hypothetical protein
MSAFAADRVIDPDVIAMLTEAAWALQSPTDRS